MKILKRVYKGTIPSARENNEIDLYKRNMKLNEECKTAIDNAINGSRYDTNCYDLKSSVSEVISKYGAERVTLLVAKLIQNQSHDGWFSSANKAWAATFEVPTNMSCYLNSHPCLIDGFANRLRENVVEKKKESVLGKLEKAAASLPKPEKGSVEKKKQQER